MSAAGGRRFSQAFKLGASQSELDFVDVPLDGDIPLFIDPFAISQRVDRWSIEAHRSLVSFFQTIIDAIRSGNRNAARALLGNLREPNETRFGLSRGKPQGAGIGSEQADELYEALAASTAVKTGFLSSLEECELMVVGIGRDKISDLTTNVLRGHLAEYTRMQCDLWSIPTQQVALAAWWDHDSLGWRNDYLNLPVWDNGPVLLVPKSISRWAPAYDHQRFYNHVVLEFLQAEHLHAGSSLVHTFKNGRQVVFKKELKARFPCSKDFLFRFSKEHPEILKEYREALQALERGGTADIVEPEDDRLIAASLAKSLAAIPVGHDGATEYHRLVTGAVEFLFFPHLLHPTKEQEIHDGRKRLDISMENGAKEGIFWRIHAVKKLPCAYVAFECKNYGKEVANPELDQIAGRFSTNRGKLGFLCCRKFEDRATFIKRCRDTLKDDRGLVLPVDDETLLRLLKCVEGGERSKLDSELSRLVTEIWVD
jgi:hypothetical protein